VLGCASENRSIGGAACCRSCIDEMTDSGRRIGNTVLILTTRNPRRNIKVIVGHFGRGPGHSR